LSKFIKVVFCVPSRAVEIEYCFTFEIIGLCAFILHLLDVLTCDYVSLCGVITKVDNFFLQTN